MQINGLMTRIASQVRARKFQLSVGLSIAAHLVAVKTGSSITPRTVSLGQENQTVCFAVPDLLPKGVAASSQVCHSIVNAGEEAQEDLDHPTVKDNPLSPAEREAYRIKRDEFLKQGEKYLDEFKKTGKTSIDFGAFLIPFEYYAQRAEEKVYLMPNESLPDLMQIVKNDLQAFKGTSEDPRLSREEKLLSLMRIVTSKSTPDPGAGVLPSMLVPDGGQECTLRTKYELILADPSAQKLLGPSEEFVILKYAGRHFDLGIFNRKEQSLIHLDINQNIVTAPQKQWKCNLYHPLTFVQMGVDQYQGQTPEEFETAYRPYLIAEANLDAPKQTGAVEGPTSPLNFNSKISSGRAGAYDGPDIIMRRAPADEQLREKRLARAGKITPLDVTLLPDATMKAIAVANEIARSSDFSTHEPHEMVVSLIPSTNKIVVSIFSPRFNDISPFTRVAEGIEAFELLGTSVSDLRPLAGFTGLRHLSLSYSRLVSDLRPLAGLTGLQRLHLGDTQVSDLRPLAGLSGLQRLDLSNTPVSDLRPLSGLTGLQELYLSNTKVSDLRPLSGLTGLQKLYLTNTKVSDLRPLSGLTGLQQLTLIGFSSSDLRPLAGLTGLRNLWLGNMSVSDLRPLSGLTGLQVLMMSDMSVGDLQPLSGLTGLRILKLAKIQSSNLNLRPLSGLTGLQSLVLQEMPDIDLSSIPKEIIMKIP
ncbi:MAG: leucine-rich repeat domain-containing protein [Candidatus Margulisiibacteriota bacterium]